MKRPEKITFWMPIDYTYGRPVLIIPKWLAAAYNLNYGFLRVEVAKGFYGGYNHKQKFLMSRKASRYYNQYTKKKCGKNKIAEMEKMEEDHWDAVRRGRDKRAYEGTNP